MPTDPRITLLPFDKDGNPIPQPGSDLHTLTKRELFAAILMAGMLSRELAELHHHALTAIYAADTLLTELAKK